MEKYKVEDARLQHIPGVAIKVADYLSRPSEWSMSPRPPEIKEGAISASAARGDDFYPLPTPGRCPDLWGKTADSDLAGPWMSWLN